MVVKLGQLLLGVGQFLLHLQRLAAVPVGFRVFQGRLEVELLLLVPVDVGLDVGVVEKKGAWLQFQGGLIGQGKDSARKALSEKPELAQKIKESILAKKAAEAAPAPKAA